LKIPENVATPYNAQATLHFYDAFWALYLPVTVAGRVSDIWRSYFTQALFPLLGLSIGFLPRPLVVQDRNPHSYTADFEAELALYLKSHTLAKFITNSSETKLDEYKTVPQAMEALWIDLYQRGYIELEDVINLQKWLQTLCDIGYRFPSLKHIQDSIIVLDIGTLPENTFLNVSRSSTSYHQSKEFLNQNKKYVCESKNFSVTFGNSDLHAGCRSYLTSAISHANQSMVLLGVKGDLKNYPNINEMNGVSTYNKLSKTLKTYIDHSTRLTSKFVRENYFFFKDDKIIQSIDAFVCTFPASMCQMWMAFEKAKIVFLPAHRYFLFFYRLFLHPIK
jgi:hypothetical protein